MRAQPDDLIARFGLSAAELAEATELLRICNEAAGLDLPIHLAAAGSTSSDETVLLLAYRDDRLVGFLSADCYAGLDECEICAMVHPGYRRRGIGSALVAAAAARRSGQVRTIYLITDEAAASGRAFV